MDANLTPDPLEQAADWQIRLSESPDDLAEFEHWLAADPRHAAAWQQMQGMLGALEHLSPPALVSTPPVPRLTTARPATPRRKRRWPRAAMAGALLALAVWFMPQASLFWRADYRTGIAETREVQLPDGSRIVLAPGSAIGVSGDASRRVQLLQGQAFFQVAPDPARPFVATAGELAVRVLGTAFELSLQEAKTEVVLEHGQVQAENASDKQRLRLSERLLPGERVQVDWATGKVQRNKLDAARVAAWRQHMLYVEDQSVADIVEQLQRYSHGWIVVSDPELAQRRISGVFDLRDPDRALQALARSLNVPLQTITPWVRVL
ncbi:FecR domain-containing protein [Pseudomonas sp. 3A(2025)]